MFLLHVMLSLACHVARSSLHCTDVALMNGCPIIHVNGDYPEVRLTTNYIITLLEKLR